MAGPDLARSGGLGGGQAFGRRGLESHPAQSAGYHGLAVDDSRVFVSHGRELTAFTLPAGDQLWSVSDDGYALLRANDLLYTAYEIRVSALSLDTGRQVWTTATKELFWCVPATDGNLLFVGAGKSVLAQGLGKVAQGYDQLHRVAVSTPSLGTSVPG